MYADYAFIIFATVPNIKSLFDTNFFYENDSKKLSLIIAN